MAFAQPTSQFTYWSEVGCNVLDSWGPSVSGLSGFDWSDLSTFDASHIAAAEAWDSAAITAGFKIARHPFTAARAAADLVPAMRAHIAGWPVQDEPEAGAGANIAPQLALIDAADPSFTVPRAMNNTGPGIAYQGAAVQAYSEQFAGYPAVQWGSDWYPVQQLSHGNNLFIGNAGGGAPYTTTVNGVCLLNARYTSWTISNVEKANHLAPAPFAIFIATAGFVENYQTTLRIPTPAQVRFQIADAIVNGAEAISFFPQRFEWLNSAKTFTSHNATPSDVKAQLITTIDHWQALETEFATNLLIDPATNRKWPTTYRICPDTVPSQVQTSADSGLSFASPPTVRYLPGPFQGSVSAVTGVGDVYFVQNMMNESKTLTDATWGLSGVSFAAWETKAFLGGVAIWSDINGVL